MPMNTGTCSYIGIRQIMLYCSRTDVPDQSPPPAQTKQKRLESLAWPRTPAQIPRTRSARTRIHRGSKRIKASALHATQNTVTSDAEQRYRPQNVIRSTKKLRYKRPKQRYKRCKIALLATAAVIDTISEFRPRDPSADIPKHRNRFP